MLDRGTFSKVFLVLVIISFILTSCSQNPSAPTFAATATFSETPAPQSTSTITPTLTPTPTPTITPTPLWPVVLNTQVPLPDEVIGVENINRLRRVAAWGLGQVNEFTYSPNGKELAVVTFTGIHLLTLPNLEERAVLATNQYPQNFIFSPDSTLAAASDRDGLYVWKTIDGSLQTKVTIADGFGIRNLAFNQDGSTLTAIKFNSGFYLVRWNTTDGSQILEQQLLNVNTSEHQYYYNVFPALNTVADLVAIPKKGQILIFQIEDGQQVAGLPFYDVTQLQFSPDGTWLAATSGNLTGVYRVSDWKLAGRLTANAFAFSPTSQEALVFQMLFDDWYTNDGTSYGHIPTSLWTLDAQDATIKQRMNLGDDIGLTVHYGIGTQTFFSPDGSRLLLPRAFIQNFRSHEVRTEDHPIHLAMIDTATGEEIQNVVSSQCFDGCQRTVRSGLRVVFSPDGSTYAAASGFKLSLWDAQSGKLLREIPAGGTAYTGLAFSNSGEMLGYTKTTLPGIGAVNWVGVLNAKTGQVVKEFQDDQTIGHYLLSDPETIGIANGKNQPYYLESVSQDGQTHVTAVIDTLQVVSPSGPFSLEGHTDNITATGVSPDGKWAASASNDRTIRIWNLETRTQQALVEQVADRYVFQFSEDGELLFCNGGDWMEVRKTSDGSLVRKVYGLSAVSPDGKLLAFGHDYALYVQSAEDDALLWNFYVPDMFASNRQEKIVPAFSADGKLLAVGIGDGTIHIWAIRK